MENLIEPCDERLPPKGPTYDQAFFLELASNGKEAWNTWRHEPANKDVYATFAGTDFSQAPKDNINFEGFDFGDAADFSRCKWRGVAWAEIRHDPEGFAPGRAFFSHATFNDETNFTGAVFGDFADPSLIEPERLDVSASALAPEPDLHPGVRRVTEV